MGRRNIYRDKMYRPPTYKEKVHLVQASCLLIASVVGILWSSFAINISLKYQRESDIQLYKKTEVNWNETIRPEFSNLSISVLMPDGPKQLDQKSVLNESHLLNKFDELGGYPEY